MGSSQTTPISSPSNPARRRERKRLRGIPVVPHFRQCSTTPNHPGCTTRGTGVLLLPLKFSFESGAQMKGSEEGEDRWNGWSCRCQFDSHTRARGPACPVSASLREGFMTAISWLAVHQCESATRWISYVVCSGIREGPEMPSLHKGAWREAQSIICLR